MSQPVRVVATLHFKPGNREAVDAAMLAGIEETRKEAGCREYAAYRGNDRPDAITVVELWDDEAALEAHMATPHMKTLFDTVKPMLADAAEILKLREIGT